VPGALIGAALALALGQVLRAFLLGLDPLDPAALAAAVGALTVMIALASLVPARRAARVEPMVALREE